MLARTLLLGLAALFGFGPVAVTQQVLKVPSQYKTIQAAINAANNDDTVLVDPGTYQENIDFKGKAITVRSTGGAAITTISGMGGSVVLFKNQEGPKSVLMGFTITNGSGTDACSQGFAVCRAGGGIYCRDSSPTIVENIIVKNHAYNIPRVGEGRGGGICVDGHNVSPTIARNIIAYNLVEGGQWCFDPPYCPPWDLGFATGAGIWTEGGTISDNIIHGNEARLTGVGACEGAGIWATRGRIVNNTVHGNRLILLGSGGLADGAGFMLGYGRPSVSNCIVWDNTGAAEIYGGLVTYSCVKGGYAGTGNIAADPALIDPANADFHLSYGSPCRDNGSNATTTSTNDIDGDPRIADGTVDMGADEFFPHLYHVGTPTPGGTIDIKLIGKPSDPAFWAYSTATLVPPASIPGLHGLLHLEPGNLVVIPIGPVPTAGVISFPVAFPPGFPRISIPTQALMGLQLSNLEIVHVR